MTTSRLVAASRVAAAAGVALGTFVALRPVSSAVAQSHERRPATDAQRETPTRIPAGDAERGRYLAHRVAMCVECHSPRDASGRVLADREFTGAPVPVERPPWSGEDWALRAPRNRGLPGYTTEIAVRLLVNGGVDREGRQLRAPMPRFRMNVQDAADVVAYLKSLP
jgi:mono/diheme cytochrome c family protein